MFFKMVLQRVYKYSIRIVIIPFFLMLIQGCKEKTAIFANLENEEKIKTSNFPDKATVLGMAKLDNRYYVSTGARLFDRRATSQNWGKTKLRSGYSRTSELVQAEIDDPIYFIAYVERDGEISKKALLKMTNSNGIEIVRKENKLQTLSITTKGKLFASLGEDGSYTYYSDYETESPTILRKKANGIILDVAEFKDETYVLTQTGLYKVENSKFKDVVYREKEKEHIMMGMALFSYSDSDGEKLIVTYKNRVWETSDGTEWKIYKDGSSTFFTDAIYIDQNAFTGLLIGTRDYNFLFGISDGYKELREGSFKKPSGNKYTSGTLYNADVLGFFLDEEEDVFFVLTKGSGLWRGSYTNTRNIDWFLE